MAREELVCPSWPLYAAASAHVNAAALADAEHHKREATIPAVFRIGNRVFVTCGASWGAAPPGSPPGLSHPPRQLSIYEIREALDHEQDDRTKGRDPDTFYAGRVFKSDMRRWLMLTAFTLLPPTGEQPEQLHQEALF
jgi:hypothetical protein